jgi:hypothetical protein
MSRTSFIGWFLDRPHMAGFEVATHGRFWVATEGVRGEIVNYIANVQTGYEVTMEMN